MAQGRGAPLRPGAGNPLAPGNTCWSICTRETSATGAPSSARTRSTYLSMSGSDALADRREGQSRGRDRPGSGTRSVITVSLLGVVVCGDTSSVLETLLVASNSRPISRKTGDTLGRSVVEGRKRAWTSGCTTPTSAIPGSRGAGAAAGRDRPGRRRGRRGVVHGDGPLVPDGEPRWSTAADDGGLHHARLPRRGDRTCA